MKKNFLKNKSLYGAFFIILVCIILGVIYYRNDGQKVCLEDRCFSVEVSDSEKEREKGLMYRQKMSSNSGMLFVFDKFGRYPFWMKNTYIPLDIVWIDENNKVVYIKENAQPCKEKICESFLPEKDARYVLEVNSGKVSETGIKVGSEMKFEGNIK
jgi:hypothetical protein